MCFNITVSKKKGEPDKDFLYLKNYYFLSKQRGTPQIIYYKKIDKPAEDWEKELNIRYHDMNPEWNYTIYPRSTPKQVKKNKKRK